MSFPFKVSVELEKLDLMHLFVFQPPKKKDTKKPETVKPPTLINGLTKDEITKEQIEEYVVQLREELEREREERNFFQLERDKMKSFQEVTDRKLDEVKAELKNLEKAIEDDEAHHQMEIKVFKQKMKHLLCEHYNTVSELEADTLASAEVLQDEQNQLEADMCKKMITILVDMQELSSEDIFKEIRLKHDEEIIAAREKWERQLAETAAKNNAEIQELQQEQDNIMKSVICERELLWKSHFHNLTEDVETSVNDTKDLIYTLSKDTGKEIKALKLQIEVDELRSSIPQKIHNVQKQADLSLRPLEDELQALKDRVEKIQAQLQSVLSAPNVDQTAVTEITYNVEKDLEARNSAIKNLKHKRYLLSKARNTILPRACISV
ncbi:dynein regulatory complex subunit 4-like [Anableps anableps]